MNMQIGLCSAILAMTNCLHSPKGPELFQPVSVKYGQHSRGWELDTISVGRPSKAKLSCPLPHCGVEITVGTCTETDQKLQASLCALQSEARRQQDWHDVPSPPTPAPRSYALLLLCCTPASVANKPPAFSIQHTPTNLINFPSRLNAPASSLPQLCTLWNSHYFEYSLLTSTWDSQTLAIRCQFMLSEVWFHVKLWHIIFGLPKWR